MSDSIYIRTNGTMKELKEQPFPDEDAIQELIAEYPDLVGGGRISPRDPRRWILVRREQGVPDAADAADRWSVDVLLIDQDAMPTIVEAKRGSNTQLRREVVGQLLEYAANASHVRVDGLRDTFQEQPDWQTQLRALLQSEDEPDADAFWQDVETNLRASNLRLLVVADEIPSELARIVEFLNAQMPNVEVLAVEVRRYASDAGETFVPTVIGTLAAPPSKSGKQTWTRATFPSAFSQPAQSDAARRLLDAAAKAGGTVQGYGSGVSIRARVRGQYYTVAWLLAPDTPESSWLPVRHFTFGAGTNDLQNISSLGNLPEDLRDILDPWADQFAADGFAKKDPRPNIKTDGIKAWCITYDDAARHIDVLVDRLEQVLTALKALNGAQPAPTPE